MKTKQIVISTFFLAAMIVAVLPGCRKEENKNCDAVKFEVSSNLVAADSIEFTIEGSPGSDAKVETAYSATVLPFEESVNYCGSNYAYTCKVYYSDTTGMSLSSTAVNIKLEGELRASADTIVPEGGYFVMYATGAINEPIVE